MRKVLYVATVVKTHIMEFHLPYLKMFKEMGWETAVAAKNDYENLNDCKIPYCDTYYNIPFERNPFKFNNIRAYKSLKKIIDEGNFDIIHCHTPVGAMVARLAANDARLHGCKVFYTAHGFHFYKGAPLVNWLLYYPAEWLMARKTDVLITITKEDYKRAREFNACKVVYVPGVGINLKLFKKGSMETALRLRNKFGIPKNVKVILSVGEVNANKNHKVVINILPFFPDVWYVVCGRGPLVSEYRKLSKQLGVMDRVIFTGYRDDVIDFYTMADIFVFPSLREGLPVALMEAMAMKLVCVASNNRGTEDLLPHSRLRFDACNPNDLREKLWIAIKEDCSKEVNDNLKQLKKFELENVLLIVKNLYLSEIS